MKDNIVNRTLLLDETNSKIRNKRPSQYIGELIDKHGTEEKTRSLLRKHLISGNAFRCMKDDDFDNFVVEREKAIKRHIVSKFEE